MLRILTKAQRICSSLLKPQFQPGYLLGLFPVNVLHSAVHFAIGVWGIVAGRGMTSPKVYARSPSSTAR
jgi:hypothetical protein